MIKPTKEPMVETRKERNSLPLETEEGEKLKRTISEVEDERTDEQSKRTRTHEETAQDDDLETNESKGSTKNDNEVEKQSSVEAEHDSKNELVESKGKSAVEKKESVEEPKQKPAFAFGGHSTFSLGFGAAKPIGETPVKVHELKQSTEGSEKETSTKPAAFGSGFAFGAGFGALNQETSKSGGSIFEKSSEESKESESKTESQKGKEAKEPDTAESDGIVKLQKQNIESGEELEKSVFQANAKLYQLTNLKDGWKERGVGSLHVNENPETGKSRIVMRSRGLLKVVLNVPLIKGVSVHKGFPASLQGDKFIRIITVAEEKTPVQYALRTGKAEIAEELYDNIVKLLP